MSDDGDELEPDAGHVTDDDLVYLPLEYASLVAWARERHDRRLDVVLGLLEAGADPARVPGIHEVGAELELVESTVDDLMRLEVMTPADRESPHRVARLIGLEGRVDVDGWAVVNPPPITLRRPAMPRQLPTMAADGALPASIEFDVIEYELDLVDDSGVLIYRRTTPALDDEGR